MKTFSFYVAKTRKVTETCAVTPGVHAAIETFHGRCLIVINYFSSASVKRRVVGRFENVARNTAYGLLDTTDLVSTFLMFTANLIVYSLTVHDFDGLPVAS